MKSPEVSIVMAVWNATRTLPAALDSVLAQTFGNFELICVDDGSEDGSLDLLREYAAKDPRIRILPVPHGGACAALNAGLDSVRGSFVGFIDNDDAMHPQLLETALAAFGKGDFDIVVWDYDSVRDESFDDAAFAPMPEIPPPKAISDGMAFAAEGSHNSFWCRLYRRRVFDGVRFEPSVIHGDMCLLWKIAPRPGLGLGHVPLPLYRYRVRDGSTVHSPWTEQKALDKVKIIRVIHGYHAGNRKVLSRLRRELFAEMAWSSYKLSRREPRLRRALRAELNGLFRDGIVRWRDLPFVRFAKMAFGLAFAEDVRHG